MKETGQNVLWCVYFQETEGPENVLRLNQKVADISMELQQPQSLAQTEKVEPIVLC